MAATMIARLRLVDYAHWSVEADIGGQRYSFAAPSIAAAESRLSQLRRSRADGENSREGPGAGPGCQSDSERGEVTDAPR